MKIVIAMDSFKGSLTAEQAVECVAEGIRSECDCDLVLLPMADGGEGTARVMAAAMGGCMVEAEVCDPLGRPVSASYGAAGNTAVIEMASASGLMLLSERERNPLRTTTYGTGQLVAHALARGYTDLVIAIGGSATNDGGAGMAQALGARLLDRDGNEIGFGGGELQKINSIDLSGLHPMLSRTRIRVACDVRNPLCGENGASRIFGPQKGASADDIDILDFGLRHFAFKISEYLHRDVLDLPGGGAAGGLGAGLAAFCGGELMPGFDLVADALELDRKIRGAALVVTGEGRTDSQTLQDKLPVGVARISARYGVPCMILSGAVEGCLSPFYRLGITSVFSCVTAPADLQHAMEHAAESLRRASRNMIRMFLVSSVK